MQTPEAPWSDGGVAGSHCSAVHHFRPVWTGQRSPEICTQPRHLPLVLRIPGTHFSSKSLFSSLLAFPADIDTRRDSPCIPSRHPILTALAILQPTRLLPPPLLRHGMVA
ncbi:hypothetical protein MN608_06218 [Microdochium nivale]|nr:hypothetical protein MN608_06218 [Microdochium nivale]